jgi:hypothetical protein
MPENTIFPIERQGVVCAVGGACGRWFESSHPDWLKMKGACLKSEALLYFFKKKYKIFDDFFRTRITEINTESTEIEEIDKT